MDSDLKKYGMKTPLALIPEFFDAPAMLHWRQGFTHL